MHFPIDSHIPTSVVLILVFLALLWGVIVACYIADVAWAVCFAQNAINSMKETELRRQAVSRRPVFIIGEHKTRHENVERLIRTV
ncbi:hypothetical protein GCK72_024249 [Caenorhabditis remanei]|uniref:Uncharacterized protein n=1 Tax=Caenorhabditis remanei TaxID=31234 RepID=A0A6A5FZ01_CAERE|nr:hypothetical protein GCK72_024249 [Caenorhabditis remanei]KAF1747783.1 hypothetical protein GCK72_024249 [Caenorhabditis remanei]